MNKRIECGDFTITIREILASLVIIAVMLMLGFKIGEKVTDAINDRNYRYDKAIQIEDADIFQYCINTNVGDAFVCGDLIALDPVSYSEIDGQYLYISKVEEHYNMHIRTYTTTDSKGHTQTHTEIYYSWDHYKTQRKQSENVTYCGVNFPSNKFELPNSNYLTTIRESSTVRFKYYIIPTEMTGTIFTEIKNNTISDSNHIYVDKSIEDVKNSLESSSWLIVFWIFWTMVIVGVVFGFYYLENDWLEN